MTDVSDWQHDAFDNSAKTAYLTGNLHVLRQAAYRWWHRIATINKIRARS